MYSWSNNKNDEVWENGRFDSIEECIEDAKKQGYKMGEIIAIGKCVDFETYVDAGDVIEILQEQAYEQCGEVSEGWIDWKADNVNVLSERLTKCINDWLKETKQEPCFYTIRDIGELVIN